MLREALLIAAAVLVMLGTALIWIPAGVIVAGLLLGAYTLLSE